MLVTAITIKISSLAFQQFIRLEIKNSIIMINKSNLNEILEKLIILKMISQLP